MSVTAASTILVPVDVSDDEALPAAVLDVLGAVDIVLLGYYPVPSQAAPAQLKHEHEADAAAELERIAERFVDADVEEILVFTHDAKETIDRVADEYDCDAVLTPGEADSIDRILAPIRGVENLDRILSLVSDLLRASEASVTFFHSRDEDDDSDHGETLLDEAVERLLESGIDESRISRRFSDSEDTSADIVTAGSEFDVVILGETEPSLRERILGAVPTRVVNETDRPTFVVRDT
jgi:nucleotide-binding universal stress UspA family protein